jgi:hypothetical protein
MRKIFLQILRPIALSMFVLLLVTASCIKNNFIIPLAYGSLTLGNILEPDDSLVFFDPDNAVRILPTFLRHSTPETIQSQEKTCLIH